MLEHFKFLTSIKWRAIFALSLALAIQWSAIIWDYKRSDELALDTIRRETTALALAFANHAEATFRSVDRSLKILRDDWSKSPRNFSEQIRLHGDLTDELTLHVAIIDAKGFVLFSSLGISDKQIYVGDHEHIRRQLDSNEDQLIISRPLQGRVTKKWSISMTRPILINGKAHGVIAISLDPTYFVKYYKDLGVGRNGAARMIRDSGEVMARSAEQDKYIGKILNTSPYGDPGAPLMGAFQRAAQADGVVRYSSYVKLPDRGVTVVVGPSVEEFMATTRDHQSRILVGGLLLSSIMCFMTMVWIRSRSAEEESQRKIRDQQERLSLATSNNGIGVWDWDLVNGVLVWDDSMLSLFHISRGEFSGTESAWKNSLFDEDRETYARDLEIARKDRDRFESEYRIKWPTGEIRYIRSVAKIFKNPDGVPVRFLGTSIDITERRLAEVAQREAELARLRLLEAHRDELEVKVAERTGALTIAKERAEEASRAKTAFLSNMSHELRTPLNQIIGISHIIRRGGLTDRQADLFAKHDVAARSLANTIEAILEVTRLESGDAETVMASIDLSKIVATVVTQFEAAATEKRLEIVTNIVDSRQTLIGDGRLIAIALTNYLDNAIRFTDTGQISVTNEIIDDGPDHVIARFDVIDTGVGIEPEHFSRLFNIFEQVDNSSTRRFNGVGLGLATTKRLALLMGGDAGCTSSLGQGSRFWFSVRLSKESKTV